MGRLLKNKNPLLGGRANIALLLAIVIFFAVVFYYSTSQNQEQTQEIYAQTSSSCPSPMPSGMIYCEDFEDQNYYDTFGTNTCENLARQCINAYLIKEKAVIIIGVIGMKVLKIQFAMVQKIMAKIVPDHI